MKPKLGLLSFVFLGVGQLLWIFPRSPDAEMGGWVVLGVFLITLFFVLSVLNWGSILSRLLGLSSVLGVVGPFALGSAVATGVVTFLGELISLRAFNPKFCVLLLGLGWAISWRWGRGLDSESLFHSLKPRRNFFFAICMGAIVLTRLGMGALPQGSFDPLVYHLLGPRLWWQDGGFVFHPSATNLGSASFWDYLAIWGNGFFSEPDGRGLIEVQLFGQWIHCLIGFVGVWLVVRRIFQFTGLEPLWVELVALAAVSSLSLKEVSWLAKNDWGAILWVLTGVLLSLEWTRSKSKTGLDPKTLRIQIAGAFFLGLGVAAKFTSVFLVLPFLLGLPYFIRESSRPKMLAWLRTGLPAFIIPIFIICRRNWAWTGNPVFPLFSGVFPNPYLGPSLARSGDHVALVAFSLKAAIAKLKMLGIESPLNFFGFFTPWVFLLKKEKTLMSIWLVSFASVLFFSLIELGDSASIRWQGPTLILWGGLNCAGLILFLEGLFSRLSRFAQFSQFLKKKRSTPRLFNYGILVSILFVVVWKSLAWESFRNTDFPSISNRLRDPSEFIGGSAKAWLRLHAKKDERILSSGDNQLYYLSQFEVTNLLDQADLDRELFPYRNQPLQLIKKLQAFGGKYLLNTFHWKSRTARTGQPGSVAPNSVVHWGEYSQSLSWVAQQAPFAAVYAGEEGFILDLEKIDVRALK